MRLGFCTEYSEGRLDFAVRAGYDCVELAAGPDSNLSFDHHDAPSLERVAEKVRERGLTVASIHCGLQHLTPDPQLHERNHDYFTQVIRSCRTLGTDLLATNPSGNPDVSPRRNLPRFATLFREYARIAEGEGVRIVFENCPAHGGYPVQVSNIGFSPEMWEAMFSEVPSPAIGLEFDPSHLVFLMIDYERALRDFVDRVYAFHAKDTEVNHQGWQRYGYFGKQLMGNGEYREGTWDFGFWRFRVPGYGDVDWDSVFGILAEAGFEGPVLVEHEDPVFQGERFDEGLLRARAFLERYRYGGGSSDEA